MKKHFLIFALILVLAVIWGGCANKTETADITESGEITDRTDDTLKEDNNASSGTEESETVKPSCVLVIEANGKIFYANIEDNPSAEALIEKLSTGEITVEMHDYGNFEKVGPLPWDLPRSDRQITTKPGDVILYQGSQITVYYDENSWNFTKLAEIGNTSKDELLEALGEGDVTVKFRLEWGE